MLELHGRGEAPPEPAEEPPQTSTAEHSRAVCRVHQDQQEAGRLAGEPERPTAPSAARAHREGSEGQVSPGFGGRTQIAPPCRRNATRVGRRTMGPAGGTDLGEERGCRGQQVRRPAANWAARRSELRGVQRTGRGDGVRVDRCVPVVQALGGGRAR